MTAAEIRAELANKGPFVSEEEFPQQFVTTEFPGQIVYGHNEVAFTLQKVEWSEGDLWYSSLYEVDGDGNIDAAKTPWDPKQRVKMKYDADSGRLEWDGHLFAPLE